MTERVIPILSAMTEAITCPSSPSSSSMIALTAFISEYESVLTAIVKLPDEYVRAAVRIYDTMANVPVDRPLAIFPEESLGDFPKGVTTLAPIYGSGMRLGTFIM